MSLTMVGYLIAATAVTLLLIFWLMNALAQRPLLQRNVREPFLRGWTAVTAPEYQYTLKLPPGWEWAFPEQTAVFHERFQWLETAGILSALPPDLSDPQLLAFSPDDEPFVLLVVPDAAISDPALWLTAVPKQAGVESMVQRQHFTGHDEVVYYQTIAVAQAPWLCRIHVHFSQPIPFRMAICGPAAQMQARASQITYVLDSFYPLSP